MAASPTRATATRFPRTQRRSRPTVFFGTKTYTDANSGLYLLSADPGSYYVLASSPNSLGGPFVPELYPDARRARAISPGLDSCETSAATLLTLADGQQVAGIDVALNIGGRLAGTIRDASTGAPIAGASVQLYAPNGSNLSYGTRPTPRVAT